MDAKNQLVYFLISIAIGFIGGVPYEFIVVLRRIFKIDKKKCEKIGFGLDIFYFILFSTWCVFASQVLRFPDFRIYLWIGWIIGLILYSKILRRIVAFFENVCYNVFIKLLKMAKSKEKTLKREE